jgi:serine/threonine protein kinase
MHRDVKPGNVLVAASGRAALADLGMARVFQEGQVRFAQRPLISLIRCPCLVFTSLTLILPFRFTRTKWRRGGTRRRSCFWAHGAPRLRWTSGRSVV